MDYFSDGDCGIISNVFCNTMEDILSFVLLQIPNFYVFISGKEHSLLSNGVMAVLLKKFQSMTFTVAILSSICIRFFK